MASSQSSPGVSTGKSGLSTSLTNPSPGLSISSFRSAVSSLVGRISFFTGRFLIQGRDLATIFKRQSHLTVHDLKLRRKRGIARRIVSYFPEETWSSGFTLAETTDPKKLTRFERESLDLITSLDLISSFCKLDTVANYGRYSCLLLGISDGLNEVNLSDPVPVQSSNKLIYVRVLDETQATVKSLNKNRSSPRWGLPEYYTISTLNPDDPSSGQSSIPNIVHWTRIIHFCPNGLTSDLYGDCDLEAVWDYLDDIDKITGSSAEIWYRHAKMLIVSTLKDDFVLSQGKDDPIVKNLEKQLEEMEDDLRSNIITDGFDINLLSAPVNKMTGAVEPIIDLMMGTLGIPKRKFFGSEQGELASGQDSKNDQKKTTKRRTRVAEKLIREFWDRLFTFLILAPPRSKVYRVVFGAEDELDIKEKAEVLKTFALANQAHSLASGGDIMITPQKAMDLVGIEFEEESQTEEDSNNENEPNMIEDKSTQDQSTRINVQ